MLSCIKLTHACTSEISFFSVHDYVSRLLANPQASSPIDSKKCQKEMSSLSYHFGVKETDVWFSHLLESIGDDA